MTYILCIIYIIFIYYYVFLLNLYNNKNISDIDNNKISIFNQIKQNIINTKPKLGKTNFGLVIKNGYPIIKLITNLYGHIAVFELASYVEQLVDIFYVGNIRDGIYLRQNGIKKPIMVLYLTNPANINLVLEYDLEIIIPSIEWYNLAKNNLNCYSKQIKTHIWFDSGLGKEGLKTHSEIIKLYIFLKKMSNIKLVGLGTKYNTADITYKNSLKKLNNNELPRDIIKQHLDFKKLVNTISDPNLIIHTACSFEVRKNFIESYFGSNGSVRLGSMIYRNITWTQPVLEIKIMSESDCYGYFCEKTDKNPTSNKFKMGLIKNYLSLQTDKLNNLLLYDKNNNKQEIKFNYEPMTFKINSKSKLKIGSEIQLIYDDLFSYK